MSEQEELRPGTELDAKLCQLLEPVESIGEWKNGISPHRFWRKWNTRLIDTSGNVFPAPVSTNWTAAGKVVEALKRLEYGITFLMPASCHVGPLCFATLWPNDEPGPEEIDPYEPPPSSIDTAIVGRGEDLPHALTLAACEALERQVKANQ